MRAIRKFCLDLFFPNRCPFCNRFIRWDQLLCDACIDAILYTGDELCSLCGKAPCICGEEMVYDRCYTACYYDGPVRDGIFRLKTDNGLNTAEFFGEILSEKILGDAIPVDYVVPVPMGRRKQRERGYNQAEVLARHVGHKMRVPVLNKLLQAQDTHIEQHTLTASERKENVRSLYSIHPSVELKDKTIVLCDDVITTGSTLNACSTLLKALGARFVIAAAGATTSLKY